MRLPRPRIKNCCIHVTDRCERREYLLGYDLDRQAYRKRLLQAVNRTLDESCRKGEPYPREPHWSTSPAVGSRQWIEGLVGNNREAPNCVVPLDSGDNGTCRLKVTQSLYQRLMKRWQNKA